ncbi:glycosyltransferase family 4 protein [Halobaculum sp. EA56]|uniref:glycosyltransferase family 4 protein n=1 Tax=Halobaculum sp. EA56 TaxID=3421648 RepID=UPI003EBE0F3D
MRILRVAQKVYPDVKGGGPYHVHAMSRDQAAMGHDVTVLTVGPHSEETRDGYRVVRRPSTASPLGNDISAGVARYLWNAVRSDEYDVVHAHSHLYFSTNLAAIASRLSGVPFAITNHGLYSQTAPESVFDMYLRTIGRWTFNRADVVFCYTEEDRNRLREFGVTAPVEVVQNGIDTERFTPEGPVSDRVPDIDAPIILFVGRLVEGKRPTDAVAALDRLRDEYPNAQLVFCGEGPLRSELDATVEGLGLRDAVTFLGHVSYDEMPSVYRGADALILPSRAEGLPRTVLEALATNIPAVVSDLDQIKSLVDGAGRTVSVGDTGGFADGLWSVLEGTPNSPQTAITDEYDWRRTAEKTTAALNRIADYNSGA